MYIYIYIYIASLFFSHVIPDDLEFSRTSMMELFCENC